MSRPLSTDVEAYLVAWDQGPWPLDWSAVFGRAAPLVLEIGFGNGEFLVDQALRSPERNHLGLERSWTAAVHLLRRIDREGTPHVRAVLADAEVALERLFAPASLAEVFVNHPCPWPKARHEERRLLDARGLALLADRMQPDARLTVVTDHAPYAAWLAERLAGEPALASCHPGPEAPEPAGRSTTKYQRKAMADGVPIHYFEWRRVRAPRSPAPRPEPAGPMPSLTLKGSCDERALFAGFPPQLLRETHEGVEIAVRLLGAYRRDSPPGWLVETLVLEDRLRQQFAVLVLPREGDELLLKLADLARPYPTAGVKRAVACVARWLLERHATLEIVHHNLGDEALAPMRLVTEAG